MIVTAALLAGVGWFASPVALAPMTELPSLSDGVGRQADRAGFPREELVPTVDERADHLTPRSQQNLSTLSKKEAWLLDKRVRRDVLVSAQDLRPGRAFTQKNAGRRPQDLETMPPIGARFAPLTTLFNVWTKEALPVLPGRPIDERFHVFLRDHYTNQATLMDTRLIDVLMRVARKFPTTRIEVVSGYRSPKYNLMLRKKGHEVARTSQHVEGNAVDFRIRGVPTQSLLRFVRSLRRGGVGYYPRSQFVHSDTGRIRFWQGG